MEIQKHESSLQTNVQPVSQSFGINQEDVGLIIDLLRNKMYEYKIRSMVQEIICNGRDAMREVGKTNNAFEVTIPNRLNPIFKVRDFGPGITPDRMTNVFIRYGASTKRGDNGATGGFGLGAKSPFAYTDSFTITTFINSIKRIYVAHVGSNNQGNLDLIKSESTTEENGTEIQLAVQQHDCGEFKDAVFRATHFWENKPVFKGEMNIPVPIHGTRLGDGLEIIDNQLLPSYIRLNRYSDEILAVIDGIPYIMNGNMVRKVKKLKQTRELMERELILYFGNGVVQVMPNREKIDDSVFTITALEKIAAAAYTTVEKHITDAFAKVKTTTEYLQTYIAMSKDYHVDGFAKYGQYSISSGFIHSALLKKVRLTTVSSLNRRGNKSNKMTKRELTEAQRYIDIKEFDNLFFVNKDESKVVQGKRMRAYMANKTRMTIVEPLNVVVWNPAVTEKDGKITPATIKSQAIDIVSFNQVVKDLSVKNFHDIAFVEEPKIVKEKVKREDESLCLHTMGVRFTHTTLASNTQKYLFVPLKDNAWPSNWDISTLRELDHFLDNTEDTRVCGVADRALKMVKNDPNFSLLSDWLGDFKATKEGITHVKASYATNTNMIDKLNSMKDIEDAFVVEMVKEYKTFKSSSAKLPEIVREKIAKLPEIKEFKEKDTKLAALMKSEYPLVGAVDTWRGNFTKDLVFYMNAVYASNKKGGK